jgi:hypothetical protein
LPGKFIIHLNGCPVMLQPSSNIYLGQTKKYCNSPHCLICCEGLVP